MSKHRLINCEFILAGSFKTNLSNKAKMLYLFMFMSADDRGFVDTAQDIISTLKKNDEEFNKTESLELVENTYDTALTELLSRGYIYEFKDNHNNKIYLIRHWFYHNRFAKGLWTNYRSFLDKVELNNNEYVFKKKPLKENKIKEDKLNENKLNENNTDNQEVSKEEWNTLFEEEDKTITEDDMPF